MCNPLVFVNNETLKIMFNYQISYYDLCKDITLIKVYLEDRMKNYIHTLIKRFKINTL